MAYVVKFGDFVFPAGLVPESEPGTQDMTMVTRPRASGSRRGSATPRRTAQTLSVRGEISAESTEGLESTLGAIRKACYDKIANLNFGRDDRYYKSAFCRQIGISYPEDGRLYGVVAAVSLVFDVSEFPNPIYFDGAVTDSLGPGGSTYTVDSEAKVLPIWEITIDDAGTGPLTLVNATTGETAIIKPPHGETEFADGDVIRLDRANYRVYYPDSGTESFGVLSGRIPTLDPSLNGGDNVISLTSGGTATVADLTVEYSFVYV